MCCKEEIKGCFIKEYHDMHIGKERFSRLYKKAFLEREEQCENEYSKNTTTWD